MSRRVSRRLLPIFAAIAVLAGCSPAPATGPSGAGSTAGPSGTVAPAATTGTTLASTEGSAWQQVRDQIGPDGSVTVEVALEAFSLAYGPLPGVTVPTGPVGPVRSGTSALRWIVAHWDEIDAAQQAEAIRLVPELAGLAATAEPLAGVTTAKLVAAQVRPPTFYTVLAQSMANEIESHVHLHLSLELVAREGRSSTANALADTGVYNAQGGDKGAAAKCVITVTQRGAAEAPADLENTVGHEVWHCYQGQIGGLAWYWYDGVPDWIVEGQAEWVGDSLRPGSAAPFWATYVADPDTRLFARSYDAMGFYAHLTQSQIDTWSVLAPMILAGDNAARYEAAGATSDAFLDSWASGYFRDPAIGPPWEFDGPGLPALPGPKPLSLSVANGKAASFSAAAVTNAIYNLSSSADIIVFEVSGHARLGDTVDLQDYVLGSRSFCTKDGGCACPPGTAFSGTPPTPLSTETLLAVTGGPDGTTGTVTGHPIEDLCRKGTGVWSLVFWSPDLGESAPPLLAAYTCSDLHSTWHAIYLPGPTPLQRTFDLPFSTASVVHRDFHFDIPPDKQSPAQTLDYSIDFTLDMSSDPPVIRVTGTKTLTDPGAQHVLQPREFGSEAPLVLKPVSLETQLKDHPEYQHPFRTQALQECGE